MMKIVIKDIFLKQVLNIQKQMLNILNLHSNLPFMSKIMKIKKCNKFVCKIYHKENFVVHMRSLKQALNHGLILKNLHRVIQFNREAWLKPYIEMNTKLRTEAKNDFEKKRKLMNNAVLQRSWKM